MAWGYPIVLLGAALENTILLGLLLPGGTLVMLGAVYAQQGSMELPLVLMLAWLGTVLGASLDFGLGRLGVGAALDGTRLGARLRPHLSAAEGLLLRHGIAAFLLAHFIGHLRSFVAITAGMTRLPVRRFLLAEGIAALVWNLIFVGLGYAIGAHIDQLQRMMSGAGLLVLLVLAIAYGGYRFHKRRARGLPATEQEPVP